MSEIVSVSVRSLDLPLTEPFEIALGTQHAASNLLVTIETAEAPPDTESARRSHR